jgi:dTDP-4-dehydrorhamnose reductase
MKVGVVGSGQVAQHIVASAKESGIDVVLIGRVDGPTVSNRAFNPNRTWEDEGDLLIAVSDCDVVINTAAFRDLNACEKDPELARKVNIDLPRLLSQRGPRQVFLSTDYVFRGLHDSKRKEDDPTDALCVYGATKAAGEREVLALGGAVVRIASPWGIYPSPERAHFVDAIVPKGISSGKLDMPTDQYFSPTYLPDVAGIILDVAAEPGMSGIFHATNSGSTNWKDFTSYIFEVLRTKVKVSGSERSDKLRPKFGALENTKLARPRHWALALEEYLKGGEKAEERR